MAEWLWPSMFVIFLWWFSTGVIVYLDGLPARTYRWSMLGATMMLLAALFALHASAQELSTGMIYVAVACTIAVWGWNEMAFLMGYLSGPRPEGCPAGVAGWERAKYATYAILYHEFALALSVLVVALLTAGAPNKVALWTIIVLWLMRLSTKLNVFLGVSNLSVEFLPPNLRYLDTYFRKASMNALFPFSVTVSTVVLGVVGVAIVREVSPAAALALFMPALMLALGILEHWFLVTPIPAVALWRWGLSSHAAHAGERSAAVCSVAPSSRTSSAARILDATPPLTGRQLH